MKEALKLALEALESSDKLINGSGNHFGLEGAMDGYYSGCFDVDGNNKLLNQAITAIKEALANHTEDNLAMVAQLEQVCRDDGRCQYAIDVGAEGMGHCPTGKCVMPSKPEQEPVVFNTLASLKNKKTVGPIESAMMNTTPPQRTWVGLTDEETETLVHRFDGDPHTLLDEVNARLKEKNQ